MRRILHVDMDAFYASVEQRDTPALRGKPVAVGGSPERRGVVAAASYEARVSGVRSAMSMAQAVRLCPQLIVVPPDFSKYRKVSKVIFDLFRSVTPLVETISLDEAYLDVTKNTWNEPVATNVARRFKRRIFKLTGLTASAGVAPNKFLAKIASNWKKPDGLTVVPPERVEDFLRQLSVDVLWGVGPVTARKLRAKGIEKLLDVRRTSPELLQQTLGNRARRILQLANGVDEQAVVPNRRAKSTSTERTYAEYLEGLEVMDMKLDDMARKVTDWLVRKNRFAHTVTIKVRYGDYTTVTRSLSFQKPIRNAQEIIESAKGLLRRTEADKRPVRLLGIGLHGLIDAVQEDELSVMSPMLPFRDRESTWNED
jgi:DNA polymerase-4